MRRYQCFSPLPSPSTLPSWGFLFLLSLPSSSRPQLVPEVAHLLHRQFLQFRKGAGEQANQERGGTADDVNHGGREDRNESVLPGEGVEQGHHRMGAAGQGAGRQRDKVPEPGPSTFEEGGLQPAGAQNTLLR